MKKNKQINSELAEIHGELQTVTMNHLHLIGEEIAKRENYKSLSGLEAVYYYLIQKHHWQPSQVRAMNIEDVSFCLSEEKFK
ncbi:MAG: hypothetical protein PHO83_16750 [Geobacteraceae bacterium]|nr:hypothetical protein [Geobacteraceae bacterium]